MKASDYRKLRAASELTAEVTLPSGAVFTLRRPPLQVWIAAGKIPQSFLLKMQSGANPTAAVEAMDSKETMQALTFVRDAIVYACVSPRLVPGTTADDELDPAELHPEDFTFLSKWIMTGSPDVPVATKGGEVPAESLDRFRQKQPGGVAGTGADGEQVQSAAFGVAGASG